MHRRLLQVLGLLAFSLSAFAQGQVRGDPSPASQTQPPAPLAEAKPDPTVLECDTSKLAGLAVEASLKRLYKTLQEKFPDKNEQAQGAEEIASLYVDRNTLGKPNGQVTTETKFQLFGKIARNVQYPYPHTEVMVVARPPEKAQSMQELLKEDQMTLDRYIKDLGQLEIVFVPWIKEPDEKHPCNCGSDSTCFRVGIQTAVLNGVFEEENAQPNDTSSAAFSTTTASLRRNRQDLERESRSEIDWFEHLQKGKEGICFTEQEVKLWGDKGRLKKWKEFWDKVDVRLERLRATEKSQIDSLPRQAGVVPGVGKPAPTPKAKKTKPPAAKKPIP